MHPEKIQYVAQHLEAAGFPAEADAVQSGKEGALLAAFRAANSAAAHFEGPTMELATEEHFEAVGSALDEMEPDFAAARARLRELGADPQPEHMQASAIVRSCIIIAGMRARGLIAASID